MPWKRQKVAFGIKHKSESEVEVVINEIEKRERWRYFTKPSLGLELPHDSAGIQTYTVFSALEQYAHEKKYTVIRLEEFECMERRGPYLTAHRVLSQELPMDDLEYSIYRAGENLKTVLSPEQRAGLILKKRGLEEARNLLSRFSSADEIEPHLNEVVEEGEKIVMQRVCEYRPTYVVMGMAHIRNKKREFKEQGYEIVNLVNRSK